MLLSHTGILPKGHTSILCDDPSIRRIYTYDTIPMFSLLFMSSIGPFICVSKMQFEENSMLYRSISAYHKADTMQYFEFLLFEIINTRFIAFENSNCVSLY